MPRTARVSDPSTRRRAPAMTVEDREDQLVAMSMDLAERQIREGTVSAQVLAHFVKIGSSNAKLEKERLIEENKLLRAKTESLQSYGNIEKLYKEAVAAMSIYGGNRGREDENKAP